MTLEKASLPLHSLRLCEEETLVMGVGGEAAQMLCLHLKGIKYSCYSDAF